jgi:hypothetical protein
LPERKKKDSEGKEKHISKLNRRKREDLKKKKDKENLERSRLYSINGEKKNKKDKD